MQGLDAICPVLYCGLLPADGYTTEDLIFEWKQVNHPVEINTDISLPEFIITGVQPTTCSTSYKTTGE